jgi:hypothetical protein
VKPVKPVKKTAGSKRKAAAKPAPRKATKRSRKR